MATGTTIRTTGAADPADLTLTPPADPAFRSAGALRAAAARVLLPPRPMTVAECAARYRIINNPGGYRGPWDHRVAPYMVEPMDLVSSRAHEGIIFVGPAQSLKTAGLIENAILHSILCAPMRTLLLEKTQAKARTFSRERIEQMNRDIPAVKARLSERDRDDNVHDKRYRGDMLLEIKWPTENTLAGDPIPRVYLTDYDRLKGSVGNEGEPFILAMKRGQTFVERGTSMVIAESSPSKSLTNPKWKQPADRQHEAPPTDGGILALYNRGDRRRFYWPCPSCRDYYEGDFRHLHWPEDSRSIDDAADRVVLVCPHCGAPTPPTARAQMLAAGVWLREGETITPDGRRGGTPRTSRIASFWLKGTAAAFQDWRSLVARYLMVREDYERTGNEESLRACVNVDQALPYVEQAVADWQTLDADDLAARTENDVALGTVADGVRFLVAFVDVQGTWFDVQVQGIGPGCETWVVSKYRVFKAADAADRLLDPGQYDADWDLLFDAVVGRTWPLASAPHRRMKMRLTAVDMHGAPGVSARAMDFWRRARRRGLGSRVRLVRGEGRRTESAPRVVETYPDSRRKDRHAGARGEVPVLQLNANLLKDDVMTALALDRPGPRYVHFPAGLLCPDGPPHRYFEEVCSETRTANGWKRAHKRNEAWDQLYVNRGLVVYLKADRPGFWSRPPAWARPFDDNPLVVAETDSDPGATTSPASGSPATRLAALNADV